PSRSLLELLVRRTDLLRRFGELVISLQPLLWKEIRAMTTPLWKHSDEEIDLIAQYIDLSHFVRRMSPEQAIEALGPNTLIQAMKPEQVIAALGPERLLESLLSTLTPDQHRQLRERLEQEEKKTLDEK